MVWTALGLRAIRLIDHFGRVAVRSTKRSPGVNKLLQSLPGNDLRRMLAGCDVVELAASAVLYSAGERLREVHFPTCGVVSLTMRIDARSSLGVGLVGNEGMLGVPLALGVDVSPLRAVVQGPGSALRMNAARFRLELDRSETLRHDIGRYVCVRLAQLAQASGCTRFHLLEARLARWLLMTQDRAGANTFQLTQESLSFMLGVRRVGITEAASALQKHGLIHYNRGHITLLDRHGLAAAACACYRSDRSTYGRLLG